MAAPVIVSKSPDTNETGVVLNKYITITFDQAMDPDSINDNTVLLYRVSDYMVLGKTFSLSTDAATITITPDIAFDINTVYNAVVVGYDQSTACVRSAGNEALVIHESWNFETGETVGDRPENPGEANEENVDLPTAASPVTLVPTVADTTTLTIMSINPENYAANQGTINGDFFTAKLNSPVTITFNRAMASGVLVDQSWVTFLSESVDGDPSTAVSMPSGTLSNVLGNTLTWTPNPYDGNDYSWRVNNEITITVSGNTKDYAGVELGNDYRFMFTTPYRPYYCSVPRIRAVIGSFVREIPDDTIARNIYLNSLEIYNIANTIYSQYKWDMDNPTFAAKMWTCCKTQYDLLYAKLLDMASQGPGMIKRLGDFSIQESTDIQAGVKGALQKALDCSNAWLKLLLGKYRRAKSKMAVKGVASPAIPPMRGVRTWTLETGRDTLGANKTLQRRIKSPGIYSDWS
jgi:hypothetical protein